MTDPEVNVITGAFSYTGKYITRRLLARGKEVRTLTGHTTHPNPFGEQVQVFPFNFEKPDALVQSLRGATTLYNTYWIRFAHGTTTFETAVKNTTTLFQAAQEAGFTACDCIVKTRKGPIVDPKWRVAHHSRRQHCYWLVFRKSAKCE